MNVECYNWVVFCFLELSNVIYEATGYCKIFVILHKRNSSAVAPNLYLRIVDQTYYSFYFKLVFFCLYEIKPK